MTNERSVTVVEGQFTELSPVQGGRTQGTNLAPFSPFDAWAPVPAPANWQRENEAGELVPYFVNRKELTKKTPPSQRKTHYKGFKYVEADYVKARLSAYAGNGCWTFTITKRELGREYTQQTKNGPKKYIEAMVGGWLLAPECLPTYGEGSAPWAQDDQGDPRFSLSTAWNSAESGAIKSAAKKWGIGADVREDPEGNTELKGFQTTCVSFFNMAVADDKTKAKAIALVKKYAPHALKDEVLTGDLISEDNVDELMNALTALVTG